MRNVAGTRQNPEGPYAAVIPAFIRDIKKNRAPIIHGNGSNSRDFTFVENVVQANIKALFCENPEAVNQVYNVAVGGQYTVRQLFDTICSITGSDITPRLVAQRQGDIAHSLADISKAKRLLDYQPTVDFEKGIRLLLKVNEI